MSPSFSKYNSWRICAIFEFRDDWGECKSWNSEVHWCSCLPCLTYHWRSTSTLTLTPNIKKLCTCGISRTLWPPWRTGCLLWHQLHTKRYSCHTRLYCLFLLLSWNTKWQVWFDSEWLLTAFPRIRFVLQGKAFRKPDCCYAICTLSIRRNYSPHRVELRCAWECMNIMCVFLTLISASVK